MPRRRRATLAVIALGIALDATAITWGLPSRYGWAVDELHPQVTLAGIEARFSGDWHQPAYPPLHYYLLALTYAPALASTSSSLGASRGPHCCSTSVGCSRSP